jgi:hypothetical protein
MNLATRSMRSRTELMFQVVSVSFTSGEFGDQREVMVDKAYSHRAATLPSAARG